MKLSIASFFLASGVTFASAKVSYDGAQAIRVPVGNDVTTLRNIIRELSLPTWKGMKAGIIKPNTDVDLVVPADKLEEFANATSTMNTHVMHKNLGLSIANEGMATGYTGEYFYLCNYAFVNSCTSWKCQHILVQCIPSVCRPSSVS
jgi:hypothetical protein